MSRCVGRRDTCRREARVGDYCHPCWEARNNLVPTDDMVEYGECPECGAGVGDQCSVEDPEQPGRGIEYASLVHAVRAS